MSKKLLYLSWAENYGQNPLVKNQLIAQLSSIKKIKTEWDIQLYLNAPLISKKSILNREKYFSDIRSIHEEIRTNGINSYKKWIIAPSTFFHSSVWQLPFLYLFNILPFVFFLRRNKYDLVHCRSYHSTIAALLGRKLGCLSYKVIFDTRGVFPEESVYHNHFKQKSLSFKMWKRIEKWALTNADCVVNVSESFTDHIRSIVPNHSNIQTIYTTANDVLFNSNSKALTDINNSANKEFKLGYLGVLGPGSWYSIKRLAGLTLEAQRQLGSARLKVITRSDHEVIMKELIKEGLSPVDIEIVQTSNAVETATALEDVSVSVIPVRPLKGEIDRLIMQVLIGAKTAEYLANGLPLITYGEATGIAQMITKYRLGHIAVDHELTKLNFHDLVDNNNKYSSRTKKFALENFSARNNARKYIAIYERLLSV